ncbi:type I site-specific deoxyribonuclease, HsdR family [Geoglobus ahangari]|uniref:type I site-specific deoxyribonuclease n=1 Tax=Geoglobus ahangari TaxID=113653 RepID=A0A0F7IEE4_9EURY|nr:type I restriction endonuclease subunit R [Geoglobus ahangari]AKG91334.1 type I site-specific deoxyribonuclease, HsdR family [Geoglobus ahangari]
MRKEKSQSEDYLSEILESFGWKQKNLKPDILALDEFVDALKRLNDVSNEDIKEVLNFLETRSFDVESSMQILDAIKKGVTIKDSEGNLKTIKLIDYENLEANSLVFSRQVSFRDAVIPDITLFVNGIPLVVIECKKMAKSWKEGYSQIKRYEQSVPELFKYVQIGVSFADKLVYFPIVRWAENVPVYEWKPQFDILKPEILLDVVRYFTFYREQDGEITKVLPRYMQYRAVNAIVERAVSYAKGLTDRNKGLIWHWQGTGKTLTMAFSAVKIRDLLGNPSIFFIVDRVELQKQLLDELKGLKISCEVIESIDHLKEVLSHADGKRGFFITLIHKFREEELAKLREQMEKQHWSIMKRKDVICLIDEGHRTQYGELAASMRGILKNASFFAFTGTPIAKKGRDTYSAFGYPDEPYLDRYFILDSINDGFTVKIAYQSRLDDVHLDRENLEIFLSSKLEEIPEEYREKVEQDLKRKLNKVKVILEDKNRIERIARDIASHYIKYVRPFKAMVVAVSRNACLYYKQALDKFLNENETEIVMTFQQNDSKELLNYLEKLKEKYGKNELKEIHEEIIARFKKKENPKILIVTDMLLTGFDAPILQTLYLDKPLKEHRLLQAIARTNRPFIKNGENLKGAGLVVDYVGIFKFLKKAFEMYEDEDIRGAAYSIEEIKEELRKKIEQAFNFFDFELSYGRDVIDRAVLVISNNIDEFRKLYFEIRNLYRLLLEDKIEFKEKFDLLSEIYHVYLQRENQLDAEIEQKRDQFYKEALKFIHETIDVQKIKKDYPVVVIDDEFIRRIKSEKGARKFYDLLFPVKNTPRISLMRVLLRELIESCETGMKEREILMSFTKNFYLLLRLSTRKERKGRGSS